MQSKKVKHTPLEVTIPLPDDWEQEVEHDNTDVFWNDGVEAGTLRVAVLVYRSPEAITDEDLRASTGEDEGPLVKLPCGGYMAASEDDEVEDGVSIHNWMWTLAKRAPENRVAVIVCTYTADSDSLSTPEALSELQTVERAVRQIELAT